MTENERDKKLTFSQREGLSPLPEAMQLKHVTTDFRNIVWLAVDKAIERESDGFVVYFRDASTRAIILSYCIRILHWPHDQIVHSPSNHRELLRKTILEGTFDEVLTLVEFILRAKRCSQGLRQVLEDAFQHGRLAYTIQMIDDLPTIVPRVSEESGIATQQAIETIEEKAPPGARTHLRTAASAIDEERYADAVRESIHAVESVARTIDPNAGNSLGSALNSLEKAGLLKHPALKEGFSKLYGYTSDENGIRHALLEESAADVDIDDAVFMFGACACFAAYLTNKHKYEAA